MKWISVKDRLPDKADDYLVFDRFNHYWISHFTKATKFLDDVGVWTDNTVTHWMPLPEPPVDKK